MTTRLSSSLLLTPILIVSNNDQIDFVIEPYVMLTVIAIITSEMIQFGSSKELIGLD